MLVVLCLYYLQDILMPLAFATLLGILLNPLNNWLMRRRFGRWKMPRILAIGLTVLLAVVLVAGLFYFISVQMAQFAEAVPQLKQRLSQYMRELQAFLSERFHVSSQKQLEYLNKGLDQALSGGGNMALSALSAVSSVAVVLTLLPIYIFLLLLYKPLLVEFIKDIFSDAHEKKVGEILSEVKSVVQSYISGLLIEMVIVAVLNVAALFILGIRYALLIGVLGAILNLVPYLGGIIAIALPVFMALIYSDNALTSVALVIAAYGVIQFLDNNLIQPRVVASKVSINALFSIIIVLAGGALWGVGGMFLSIPLVAILKIVFDRVSSLKPWGRILGDEIPGVDDDADKDALNERKKTVVKK